MDADGTNHLAWDSFPFASVLSQREAVSPLDCGDYANETMH